MPLHGKRNPRGRRTKSCHTDAPTGLRDRKTGQLCRQVAHTLDEVLAECRDATLQGLRVASVEPFPDASRLLVTLVLIDDRPEATVDAGRALDRLQRASGHLRFEVATAITRKRAPLLMYRLAEPAVGG
jgi:ribosome-binding factor A